MQHCVVGRDAVTLRGCSGAGGAGGLQAIPAPRDRDAGIVRSGPARRPIDAPKGVEN